MTVTLPDGTVIEGTPGEVMLMVDKLKKKPRVRHLNTCATEDPEYYGPCTCGIESTGDKG